MSAHIRQVVCYMPTDVEATAGGGSPGDTWAAMVCTDSATPALTVFQADGTTLAKTGVSKGTAKGEFKYVPFDMG